MTLFYIIKDLANDSSYNSDDEYGPPDDQQDIIRNVPESVFQAIEELLIKHDPRSLYLINVSPSLFSFTEKCESWHRLSIRMRNGKIPYQSRTPPCVNV